MTENEYKERQARKALMRKNMRVNPHPDYDGTGSETEANDEDTEEVVAARKKRRRRILIAVALIFVLLAGGIFVYQKFFASVQTTGFKENWAVEMKENNFSHFLQYGENIVKYDRDGASYYNAKGEMIWTQAFEMSSPTASVNGNCLAIADQKGYNFYTFNTEGLTGQGNVTLPISRVAVAGNGVTAIILEDSSANYIQFFNAAGQKLDIEIKTVLSGDGYPIDISLSPDGTILMASYVFLRAGMMQNKVIFYNFSESGKNVVQRIVGGYEQYGDAIVADVEMLSQKQAVAFADDRITFYSLKNELSPEVQKEIEIQGEVKSIFCGEGNVGVITEKNEDNGIQNVTFYSSSGAQKASFSLNFAYTKAEFSGSYAAFFNDYECRIYTLDGRIKYEGALAGSIVALTNAGGNSWLQIGGQTMTKITLQ